MIRRDILFREHPNIRSELTTDDDEVLDDKMKSDTEKGLEEDSWDTILDGDDAYDDLGSDCDDDDVFVQSIN